MTETGKRIVDLASIEIGNRDETRYGAQQGDKWCSEFVAWVYNQAGAPFSGGALTHPWLLVNVEQIKDWFTQNRTFIGRDDPDWPSFTPSPGDYVCFGNKDDPESHSGIFDHFSGGSLLTIEGNVSDMVDKRDYPDWRTSEAFHKWVQGFGLRNGKQIKLPNGTPSASSSGDDRPPENAFDGNPDTFWRNRSYPRRRFPLVPFNWLQMAWNTRQTVTKVSLTFGNHIPADFQFFFKVGKTAAISAWSPSVLIRDNDQSSVSYIFEKPVKNVFAIRLVCMRYASDDYFSVEEMAVFR